MNHSKLGTAFFVFVFTLIIVMWAVMGFAMYKSVSEINEHGLRGLSERIWCGKDAACTLPAVLENEE